MHPRRAFFKSGKSCGCVIASNIISLEILRKKLAKAKRNSKTSILGKKHRELAKSLKDVHKHKKYMKKKFEDYVRESGYVPPKLKSKRW